MIESDGKGGNVPVWYKAGDEVCYSDGTVTVNGYCVQCGMPGSLHKKIEAKSDQKRNEFDAIRAKAQEINRLFGGKLNIKEWDSGGQRVFKVVLQWSVVASKRYQTENVK